MEVPGGAIRGAACSFEDCEGILLVKTCMDTTCRRGDGGVELYREERSTLGEACASCGHGRRGGVE